MTDDERKEWDLKMRKLDMEIEHLRDETTLLLAQARWEPWKSVGMMAVAFFIALGAARIFGWIEAAP